MKVQMGAIPIGANFVVGDRQKPPQLGDSEPRKTVYVRIPEMTLILSGSRFTVNCIYEKGKESEFESTEMISDCILDNTLCEYWWPER